MANINLNDFHDKKLGSRVYIFSPSDSIETINEIIARIFKEQEANQFGKERYALFFMPGKYDSGLRVDVGFYTQVAGLGFYPTDTKIPFLQCNARWRGTPENHVALCNFWRGVENLEVEQDTMWAVSQATFMRRVQIDGKLFLHDEYGWASGGFLADSFVTDIVDSGSQQQWLSRNNQYKGWQDEHWNQVFVGDEKGCTPKETWPEKAYTVVEESPIIREKPFLCWDSEKGFGVFVPDFRRNASGFSWKGKNQRGQFIALDEFYVANPEIDNLDEGKALTEALAKGKHLLFTPGIYYLAETLKITKENTLVLGIGLASLVPTKKNTLMEVDDVDGVVIAGLLFDAGEKPTKNLLVVGNSKTFEKSKNHQENPVSLSDLFFRVGGTDTMKPTKTDCCATIYAHDTVGDNFWLWRADHGSQVGWTKNVAKNGLKVYGNRTVFYALMVEHFNEYQTLFLGEDTKLYMYQSEIPYDVPAQKKWRSHKGKKNGYSSICIDEKVERFLAYGIGIYLCNKSGVAILDSSMEAPKKEGIEIHNVCNIMLTPLPGIKHIINDEGEGAMTKLAHTRLCEYRGKLLR